MSTRVKRKSVYTDIKDNKLHLEAQAYVKPFIVIVSQIEVCLPDGNTGCPINSEKFHVAAILWNNMVT